MEPFLGTILAFGFNFAPRGWMTCQGQLLSIAQNSALFALLGTIYGGDGQTTFALPDLRGRAGIGQGQGPGLTMRTQGEVLGVEQYAITTQQMPAHNHTATAASTAASTSTSTSTLYAENIPGTGALPANKMLAGNATVNMFTLPTAADNKAMSSEAVLTQTATTTTTTTTVAVNVNGGGLPVSTIQPVLCLNYCIATEGLFPSRN